MIFGQVHYSATCFLTWMMRKGKEKKMMVTMKRKKNWNILMKEIRMKVKKMRRRKMKEKMTNGTGMDSNLPFLIFSSPWEQVAVFFFSFPVLSHPVFKISFPLYTKVHNLFGNTLSRIQWKRSFYSFLFQIHFYPFLSQQRL